MEYLQPRALPVRACALCRAGLEMPEKPTNLLADATPLHRIVLRLASHGLPRKRLEIEMKMMRKSYQTRRLITKIQVKEARLPGMMPGAASNLLDDQARI